ncbi:MAG: hypothetical protein U0003_05420 [Vampirovibrionales bacterium]
MGAGTFAIVSCRWGHALARAGGASAPQGIMGAIKNPLQSGKNMVSAFKQTPNAVRESRLMMTNGVAKNNLTYAANNARNTFEVVRGLGDAGKAPKGPAPTGYQNTATPPGPRPSFLDRKHAELARAKESQFVGESHILDEASNTYLPAPIHSSEFAARMQRFEQGLDYLKNTQPLFAGQGLNLLGINTSGSQFFGDVASA